MVPETGKHGRFVRRDHANAYTPACRALWAARLDFSAVILKVIESTPSLADPPNVDRRERARKPGARPPSSGAARTASAPAV